MSKKVIRFISIIMIYCFFLPIFGCGIDKTDEKINIISTVFPSYDFAKQIIGENNELFELTQLLPPGTESHAYEPSPRDIVAIQECDLFIYVGGESDTWVDTIINSFDTPPMTLKLMECSSLVEEEDHNGLHHEGEHKYDEHVWTSIANAISITEAICEKICEIDSRNKEIYKENSIKYCNELKALQKEFNEFFAMKKNKLLLYGDRFPMRYFAQEFDLDYMAAFPGCGGQTEPDAATLINIIDTVKEKKIKAVFYIEFSNKKVAKAIAEETGCEYRLLHSCHNVSKQELKEGCTYIKLMRNNLETLREVM